jgi:hypothetical protein
MNGRSHGQRMPPHGQRMMVEMNDRSHGQRMMVEMNDRSHGQRMTVDGQKKIH